MSYVYVVEWKFSLSFVILNTLIIILKKVFYPAFNIQPSITLVGRGVGGWEQFMNKNPINKHTDIMT